MWSTPGTSAIIPDAAPGPEASTRHFHFEIQNCIFIHMMIHLQYTVTMTLSNCYAKIKNLR